MQYYHVAGLRLIRAPCSALCLRWSLTPIVTMLVEQQQSPPCMHMLLICPFFISYSAMPTGRSVCSCTCQQIHDSSMQGTQTVQLLAICEELC